MYRSHTSQPSGRPIAWLIGLVTVLATAACGAQQPSTELAGSGVIASEQRTTGTFTSLSITGKAIDTYVAIGSPLSVKLTSDDNIVPLIITKVQNEELTISLDRVVSTQLGMRVDVTMPAVTRVSAGPAVKIHLTGLAGGQLAVDGGVGSQITASGQAAHVSLTMVGGSRADMRALEARDAQVSLSGASTAEVLVTDSVTGEARGISHLGVWGQSPSVNVRASEGSTVTMMGVPMMSS